MNALRWGEFEHWREGFRRAVDLVIGFSIARPLWIVERMLARHGLVVARSRRHRDADQRGDHTDG